MCACVCEIAVCVCMCVCEIALCVCVCVCVCVCAVAPVVSNSLPPYGPSRLLCPWDSPGKNTGVGFHALLQGIFPTQGLNWHLLRRLLNWKAGPLLFVSPGNAELNDY